MSQRRRLAHGFAFLLAATGLGFCGYAGLLWREIPHYSEADIAQSADLNLAIDLARDGKPQDQLDSATLDTRRTAMRQEIRNEIAQAGQPARAWLWAGLALLGFAVVRWRLSAGRS